MAITNMKQITVSIGNSDNKLTQVEWSEFVQQVDKIINECAAQVHFFGGSVTWTAWQNVAWLFDCKEENIHLLLMALVECRHKYRQESVAFLEGEIALI